MAAPVVLLGALKRVEDLPSSSEPLEPFNNSIFPVADMKQDERYRSYLGTNVRPHRACVDAE